MSQAHRTYLKTILDQERQKSYPKLDVDEHFEIFVAEQLLKFYALDSDDIASGISRGSGDGGIDGAYFFIDRKLIRQDPAPKEFRTREQAMDLILIQASTHGGFTEDAMNRLIDTTNDLLDVGNDLAAFTKTYNSTLLEILTRFRSTYLARLTFKPRLTITYYYACHGDSISVGVKTKAEKLKKRIGELFSAATCDFQFFTAKDLLTRYNTPQPRTLTLHTLKMFSSSNRGTAFVCIAPLGDFYGFITDEQGQRREDIFESNVRDYHGNVKVNNGIRDTLTSNTTDEFWWLNNGVTILATKATSSGDILTIDEPEIVNGLQTCREIYNAFAGQQQPKDDRSVLVRVIQTDQPAVRDRIIGATNSQNPMPSAALHASEDIQRQIETYLPSVGLYYERRKNYHRNRGVAVDKIVSITGLAQAVAAVTLQKPDDARGRPSTVVEQQYGEIFSEKYPPELYAKSALLVKHISKFLRSDKLKLDRGTQLNLLFHLAMYTAANALKKEAPSRDEIAALDVNRITDNELKANYRIVKRMYTSFINADNPGDKVSKGPEFMKALKKRLHAKYPSAGANPLRSHRKAK